MWLTGGLFQLGSQARKNRLKPKSKQESVTFMPLNKEVKINNKKLFCSIGLKLFLIVTAPGGQKFNSFIMASPAQGSQILK